MARRRRKRPYGALWRPRTALDWGIVAAGLTAAGATGWYLWARWKVSNVFALPADSLPQGTSQMTLEQLTAALPPEGKALASTILQVSQESGVDPLILAGLLARESGYGTQLKPPGPGGTGDWAPRNWTKNSDGSAMPMPPDGQGWGRGLAQLDFYWYRDWLSQNNWQDPYTNLSKGAQVLLEKARYLALRGVSGDQLLRGALAAYNSNQGKVLQALNAGLDPDSTTTGGDYSRWILAHAATYAQAAGVSSPTSLPA